MSSQWVISVGLLIGICCSQRRVTILSIQKKSRKPSDMDRLILAVQLLAEEIEEIQTRIGKLEKGENYNECEKDAAEGGMENKEALA